MHIPPTRINTLGLWSSNMRWCVIQEPYILHGPIYCLPPYGTAILSPWDPNTIFMGPQYYLHGTPILSPWDPNTISMGLQYHLSPWDSNTICLHGTTIPSVSMGPQYYCLHGIPIPSVSMGFQYHLSPWDHDTICLQYYSTELCLRLVVMMHAPVWRGYEGDVMMMSLSDMVMTHVWQHLDELLLFWRKLCMAC